DRAPQSVQARWPREVAGAVGGRPRRVAAGLTSIFGDSEAVADAPHGLDQTGARGIPFALVAEPADVDLEIVAFGPVLRAPYLREQRFVRHGLASARRELHEQVELDRCEPHLVDAAPDSARGEVDTHVAALDEAGPVRARRGAADHGLYAGDQLARTEGLHHVVVRAELEAADLVVLETACRQHDD